MTDKFAMYDAAYLLGALPPPDRAEFETHLSDCQDCRSAVNQLAGMPGLLAGVSLENATMAVEDGPELPETLLPRLLAEVQRARFRRRWTAGLVGVAAAAILAAALVVGIRDSPVGPAGPAGPPVAAQRMKPVSSDIPVKAKVVLASKQWGTALTIWCTYEGTPDHSWPGPFTYTLVVTDKSGATQQIAAWSAKEGQPVVAYGSTSVPESQIASVLLRGPSDMPLMWLRP